MELLVSLRVLYTVNNAPQYILAKSSSPVSVLPCNEATAGSSRDVHFYARAPLKTCIQAVCDSSPELLQDSARDFSLYFLDPLEAQPIPTGLSYAPQDSNSPRGVAVALGLMSRALESDDSMNIFVTGTIIPNSSPSLEVVCALRETKRVQKPTSHSYLSFGPTSAPGLSRPCPSQSVGMSWPVTSHLQPDQQRQQRQTLTRSADFPELYIGPPRRARGRPEGSTSSKSKLKAQLSSSSLPSNAGASSSEVAETRSESKKRKKTRFRSTRGPPTDPPFICAPLTRNTATEALGSGATGLPVPDQQSHPQSQNPLQGFLSAISSTSFSATPEQQAALLSALQGFLAVNTHLAQPQQTNAEHLSSNGDGNDEQDDGDSDIVVLDSSTIDTTVFRKSSTRQQAANNQDATSNQESVMTDIDSSPLPASTPFSGPETSTLSEVSTPSATNASRTEASTSMNHTLAGQGSESTLRALDVLATPTSSLMRKRKLDEYSPGQARSVTPSPPPSPSPSVMRTSGSRALTTRRQDQSSPTRGTKWTSSPLARLPSMLSSLRGTAASAACPQAVLGTHEQSTSSATDKHGNQPSELKAEHAENSCASLDRVAPDPKRRRTLSEFMAEHEARKSTKVRKRSNRRPGTNESAQVGPLRSANIGAASRYAQSSPPRPLFRSDSMIPTFSQPTSYFPFSLSACHVVSDPAQSSATTLAMPSTSVSPTKNPLKNFVMPAWARTNTSTLPRLSEEALARQRAEQEAKKAQLSFRRREVARAKRRHQRNASGPSKESSDEDEDTIMCDAKSRTHLPPSPNSAQDASLSQPYLPVFASDVVEPIPSSPPRLRHQPTVVPKTPPRTPVSSGSATRHTPSKPSSCSLFTPSGQDPSLFTPSTPCVTRSLGQATFTPRSPTVLRSRQSPRKSALQTPSARRSNSDRPTPRRHTDRNLMLGSPSVATRTPQTRTGMGTRAFLLPPPSPCALRTPQRPSSSTLMPDNFATLRQEPTLDMHDKNREEEDILGRELDGALHERDLSRSPTQRIRRDRARNELPDMNSGGDVHPTDEDYASSPLPPSSPLPASPSSSPGKNDTGWDASTVHDLVPDSDMLLPSSDGPPTIVDSWLSDDANTAATWLTDSETSAWFTETEAWMTDAEGLPSDSNSAGAWLSDSDAVFGDMSTLTSNWLSDDADVDTDDGGLGAMGVGIDFQKAYDTLVKRSEQSVGKENSPGGDPEGSGSAAQTHGTEPKVDSQLFWESIQPLFGTLDNNMNMVPKVVEDMQTLLDGLAGK